MTIESKIEWTDSTWNCIRGCDKISEGCRFCYAETFAERFRGTPGHPYEQGFDLRLVHSKLNDPIKWKKPKKIFVNSMSDMFHEKVPDSFLMDMAKVMVKADWHIYQCLTKRSERLRDTVNSSLSLIADLKYIWWGVSVENRKSGLPRIDHLRDAKVKLRFLSIEPLLEDLGEINLEGIHWVICGGESGPGCRPMNIDWARNIRDQCDKQKIPFFLKQLGGHPNKQGGDLALLDGVSYHEMPSF